jgi:hypothetical protein
VSAKADAIGHSVDGTATAQIAKIEALQGELKLMREALGDSKQRAALLAQSTAVQTKEGS